MGYEVKCESCEVSFEISISDYVLVNDEPQFNYCPNCGEEL